MPSGFPKSGINKGWFKKGGHSNSLTEFKKGSSGFRRKHREESKIKMSLAHQGKRHSPATEFKKGCINKWTPESKEKVRLANTGRKFSLEIRKRMSEAHTGKQIGEKNNRWKGGITPLVQQIRHCFKYRQWRSDIFTRDDFICQKCGIRGGKLEADHFPKMFSTIFHENKIISFGQAESCEEFWNLNNGRTLCRNCHRYVNGKLGGKI